LILVAVQRRQPRGKIIGQLRQPIFVAIQKNQICGKTGAAGNQFGEFVLMAVDMLNRIGHICWQRGQSVSVTV
jgi:hypothetical protein